MLDRYLRKNFGKFVEFGEFGDDREVEQAFRRHRMKRRALQLAVSIAVVVPVLVLGFVKFRGGKGREEFLSPEEYYALGMRAYEEGSYEKASSYFEEVVKLGPPEELGYNTYMKLADSIYNVTWPDREEPYRKALYYYEQALGAGTPEQLAPHMAWIYYQMGNCQRNVRAFERSFDSEHEDGENRGAIDYYDEVISKYSSSAYAPPSIYYKASCYRAAEEFIEAREIYHELWKRYPRHSLAKDVFFDIADCFVEEAKTVGMQTYGRTMDLTGIRME